MLYHYNRCGDDRRYWLKPVLLGQILVADGEAADALAGYGKDGVADRGRYHRQTGLADSGGIFLAHYQVDFDLRHFAHARHVVVVEVGLLHAAVIDGDGIFHHRGQRVHGGAFNLRYDSGGIHRAAAIDGVDDAMHAYLALFHADLGDRRRVRLEGKISGDAAADALRQRFTPLRFFGGELQNTFEACGIERLVFFGIREVGNFARLANQLQAES